MTLFRKRGMSMSFQPLPIGIDDFEKLITEGYYYVDKSLLIKELLDKKGAVNLFTRPRRFGKSLNMSMLQCFFENSGDDEYNKQKATLFNGLKIMNSGENYLKHFGQYPVINLTFKSSKQPTWELAYGCIKEEIGREYARHKEVLNILDLPDERRRYLDILNQQGRMQDYISSLRFLVDCLQKKYQSQVIILIDEYDVPLENAYFSGFYTEMIHLIRSILESSLKGNPGLAFAVMTGCLRFTKESIFTGLNNLEMISILNASYDEYFGFTQSEIDIMLDFYQLSHKRDELKEWYDGYRFGNVEVYNPWSVTNYIKSLKIYTEDFPRPYWANTSSNSIVRNLVERADASIRAELEHLIAGGTIEKPIHEDITYDSVDKSEDNLWNFLFFTGYLKQLSSRMEMETQYVTLAIPNHEIRYIYRNTISNWFYDEVKAKDLSLLYKAMLSGNTELFQQELSALLRISISYMDSKEAFYHGFLLGVLGNLKDCLIKSNREAGDGRLDIAVLPEDIRKTPIIIELKVSDTFKNMEMFCNNALQQIFEKKYYDLLEDEGYSDVRCYGISFFKKQCLIKTESKNLF